MKRKCVFSVVAVITLAALSVVAFVSSLAGISADEISEQRTVSGAAVTTGPETTTELRQTVAEIAPTEKPIEITYQSLVASMYWDEDESYLLAKIAMAEAEDEDTEGKALVIRVVLNRVKSKKFPDSIKKVIYQERQFSPITNGRFDRVEPNEDCQKALDMIAEDGWDESRGALYFESKSASTWHEDNLQYLFRHGNHYFYTDREEDSD